ncbi:Deleted in malignant brain tumors 1 protein, partial [Cathartes aura]
LRLVNGPHRCAGRVEVFHSQQWGTVCDDSWDLNDAAVVCRQLGCGTAVSAPGSSGFGQGSGPIWLDGVSCLGTEATLAECSVKPWGHHACNHVEDASVVCSGNPHRLLCSGIANVPRLRLVGDLSKCAGRVEVFYNNEWGTVCDDNWDLMDAAVVCRQLGCGVALSAPSLAQFGWGVGPIWLDDVSCTGQETDFFECRAKMWGIHNCHHGEDAGVVCAGESRDGRAPAGVMPQWDGRALPGAGGVLSPQPWALSPALCASPTHRDISVVLPDASAINTSTVRLVDGPHRVEVFYNNEWGTVCDDNWDLMDAAVVCRQLGCGMALSALAGASFGRGLDPIWLDRVACFGGESTLTVCRARPWGINSCTHEEDAGVVCSGLKPGSVLPSHRGWASSSALDANVTEGTQVRLVNGPNRCAGRVEVLHEQQWGTVCDDSWDLKDAKVVCRQLGDGTAVSAPGQAHFGQGLDPIWLDDVECTGMETTLSQCSLRSWGLHNCNHDEDVGVVC